jgi:hypothetical protein
MLEGMCGSRKGVSMGFPFERWTEKQEEKLVWMINNGYSPDCCAKHLGRSELAILYRMDKLNLRRLSREEIERGGKKYIYNGLGRPCSLTREMILAKPQYVETEGAKIIFRPIAEMHKDLDAFERKHGDTYREVFGENLLSPAKMSVLLSRREKEKQEFNQSRWVDIVPEQFKVGDTVLADRRKGIVVCEVITKDAQGNYLLRELVGDAKCCRAHSDLKKTSFPEKPKLYFDHSPMYGSVPCYCYFVGRFDVWWDESDLKLKIWYHSPKTGVFKSRWVDINKIHSI